jgi:aspartate aminotransferase
MASMFKCVKPRGAFYLFPDVSDFLKSHESAAQLAEWILDRAHVAVVPGEAFGVARHLRISYGVSEEKLIEGLERLTALKRS